MPIPVNQFPMLREDQVNAFGHGLEGGQNFGKNILESMKFKQQKQHQDLINAILGAQAPYAGQRAKGEAGLAEAQSQWFGPTAQQNLQQSIAQTGLIGKQGQKIDFEMAHPELFGQSPAAMFEWMKRNGIDISGAMGGGQGQPQQQGGYMQEPQAAQDMPDQTDMGQTLMPPTMGGQGQPMQNQMQGMQGTPSPSTFKNPNNFLQSFLRKNFLGNEIDPYQQANLDLSKSVAQAELPLRTERIQQAQQLASTSASTKQNVAQFMKNYDKAFHTGPGGVFGGGVPVTGIKGGIASAFHDLTPEVEMDQASQKLQTDLIPTFQGKMTEGEFNFLSGLKLYREMPKKAAEQTAKLLNAGADRAAEYQNFIQAGIQKGYPISAIDTAWTAYTNHRPIIDVESQRVNHDFKNTGTDYLTKKAMTAIMNGQPYEVITDKDIAHTARQLGVDEKQIRAKLHAEGRL